MDSREPGRGIQNQGSPSDLAHAANLGTATVKRFEVGLRTLIPNNMKAVIQALEAAGIEFIPRTKTKGPGVRLKE